MTPDRAAVGVRKSGRHGMLAVGRIFERKVGAMAGPIASTAHPSRAVGTRLATNMAMQSALRPAGWPPP
jgi:hypothetical protein